VTVDAVWLTNARALTPHGVVDGAVGMARGRILAIRARAPRGARAISARGAFVAAGFIDLHVWGEPQALSVELIKHGTTAFLAAAGPEPPGRLAERMSWLCAPQAFPGAECLGVHLEGPFLNPSRAGALPRRWMRAPSVRELERLARAASRRIKLITLAPELPAARAAIRWCRQHGLAVSLGHSDADAVAARRAIEAGASAVTHVFNAMRPFHHRRPSLVEVALTDPRLTTMVIADGIHVSPAALRLVIRAKGADGVALVTDAVRGLPRADRRAWGLAWRGGRRNGAYYTREGILAGSGLTMMDAVRNAVELGGATLEQAVGMASATPARLLGGERDRGRLAVGRRADLTVFDRRFRVRLTVIGGRVVYER
jgi:N-acetylglucosamine-6-phosphate deacetylase